MKAETAQEQKVRRFFSAFSEKWDSLYGGRRIALWRLFDHTFRRDVYERYQLTFERLGSDLGGKTVLDIGCGSGVYCIEAARRGAARVVGIDVSEEMVALAKVRSQDAGCSGVCEFVCTSFPPERSIEALKCRYDYAIVMGVMDYVQDVDAFLKHLRSQVTQFTVLSFPGKHWLRAPIRRYRYHLLRRCAVYTYDEDRIYASAGHGGFRRVDIQRLDHSGICYLVTAYV